MSVDRQAKNNHFNLVSKYSIRPYMSEAGPDVLAKIQKYFNAVVELAKQEYNRPWGGKNPTGAELGYADLRFCHMTKAEATYYDVWQGPLATTPDAGKNNYFAGTTSLATDTVTIDKDHFILIWGVMDVTTTPLGRAIKFEINGKQIPTIDIQQMHARTEKIRFLDFPIIVSPNSSFIMWVWYETAPSKNADFTKLLGHVIGIGSEIIKRAPA
jgi:hypothetical protein